MARTLGALQRRASKNQGSARTFAGRANVSVRNDRPNRKRNPAELEPVVDTTADAASNDPQGDDAGGDDESEVGATVAAMAEDHVLQELKGEIPADLLAFAETFEVENANSMRKQDMMFAILKTLAEEGVEIPLGDMEVLQDGFGFLRSPEANYLPVRTISTSRLADPQVRPAPGDTIDGAIRAPREGERYFALTGVALINLRAPTTSSTRSTSTT